MFVVKWSDIHYKRLMLMIMVMMVKGDEFFFFIRIRLSFTQSGGNFFSFIYEQRLYIYIQYIHWENISYNQSINQFLVIKFPYHYCHQFIANSIDEWKRKNPINWSIIEMPEMKFFFITCTSFHDDLTDISNINGNEKIKTLKHEREKTWQIYIPLTSVVEYIYIYKKWKKSLEEKSSNCRHGASKIQTINQSLPHSKRLISIRIVHEFIEMKMFR